MKIKFSHKYDKMPIEYLEDVYFERPTILVGVFKTHKKDLPPTFIEYDTSIYKTADFYPLPNTEVLILLLLTGDHHLWTTIRRWTAEKEKYYKSNVGEEFKIEIAENIKRRK